jgi:hypothetical protein
MSSAASTSSAQAPPRISIVSGSGLGLASVATGVPADRGRAQRALDDVPGLVEEAEPGDHPCGQCERHFGDAVAQLTDVIHQRHAAFGVLLPLGVHEVLTDDAGAGDGTGKLGHDRSPAVRQARLAGLPHRAGGLGVRCGWRLRLVLVQALHLLLQDAHRLAERPRRGRKLLDPNSTMITRATIRIFHGLSNRSPTMCVVLSG